MENVLSILFSLQTIIFCLGIYLSVLIGRRIIEAIAKKIAKLLPDKANSWIRHVWEEWLLPGAPVAIGGLIAAFVKQYPYPDAVVGSELARIFYGLIAGWASAYVYRSAKALIKKVLPQKTTEELESVVADKDLPDPEKLENKG
jgi:SNF family Na+-dependent transporter